MKILLVRHAESEANVNPSKLYLNDNKGIANPKICLTAQGIEQANENGLFLKKYLEKTNLKIKVWNSPYQRTRQTMEISTEHYLNDVVHYQTEESPLLSEIQFGLVETVRRYHDHYPHEYQYYHAFKAQEAHFFAKAPMGESPAEMVSRLKIWVNGLSMYSENDLHIVYSHGAAIRALLLTLQCLPYEIYYLPNPVNASIMEVDLPMNLHDHDVMLSKVKERTDKFKKDGFPYIFKPKYYISQ